MEKAYSKYARIFDEKNVHWRKNHEANLMFIKYCQQYTNELLKTRNTVFLNEVYKILGFPRSQEGCVVGWHYDEKNPIGDNYIDFIISDKNSSNIVLDFNVDGRVDQYL
jgi:hypothetical protein